ncbi:MAG: rhodanese-like domain-containing protein [Bdellovibrionales bacterium]|nr:rhodanese-like domain-containing protein [Bdellovibrionales bacterium]
MKKSLRRNWPYLFPLLVLSWVIANGPLATWSVETIPTDEAWAFAKSDQAVFVDVREPDETQSGYLPGAILMPLSRFEENLDRLPKDKLLLTYCRSGARAKKASAMLLKAGFKTKAAGGYAQLKH